MHFVRINKQWFDTDFSSHFPRFGTVQLGTIKEYLFIDFCIDVFFYHFVSYFHIDLGCSSVELYFVSSKKGAKWIIDLIFFCADFRPKIYEKLTFVSGFRFFYLYIFLFSLSFSIQSKKGNVSCAILGLKCNKTYCS